MDTYTAVDQMGRTVQVPYHPQRIISLVPSQTELLFDLGLDVQIVGVTKFCVHPASKVTQKQSVGGTKQFRFDVIEALQPDLIFGNKEENYREGIEQLAQKYPVWVSDIKGLPGALDMVRRVGALVNRAEASRQMAHNIAERFAHLGAAKLPLRTAYVIWQKPIMVVGAETFIHDMLTRCGLLNAVAATDGRYAASGRYPTLTLAQLHAADLDLILLSSEPFPFKEKHRQAWQTHFPAARVELVDGEMFSWYGSRLLSAVPYFAELISRLAQV